MDFNRHCNYHMPAALQAGGLRRCRGATDRTVLMDPTPLPVGLFILSTLTFNLDKATTHDFIFPYLCTNTPFNYFPPSPYRRMKTGPHSDHSEKRLI
ncbi:MAG TPA: hypothetical protein PKB07_25515 [Flavilitoribacter sp.]|nr:hypothetical protein [Flavilitoribacter sp.]